MNRRNIILKHIDKKRHGVEIAPNHNPVASKSDGFNVGIIDRASQQELVEKYKDHGVNLNKIEEVDFIWKGERYAKLTGKKEYYDWIIASHVIEHTPDFIAFLNDCASIITEDARLSLVVPDKRYCFDQLRVLQD